MSFQERKQNGAWSKCSVIKIPLSLQFVKALNLHNKFPPRKGADEQKETGQLQCMLKGPKDTGRTDIRGMKQAAQTL